jgi:hypothetical protein
MPSNFINDNYTAHNSIDRFNELRLYENLMTRKTLAQNMRKSM